MDENNFYVDIEELLQEGVGQGLVRLSPDGKSISYNRLGFTQDLSHQESRVLAFAYLSLILKYHYPESDIVLNEALSRPSTLAQGDIIVYRDSDRKVPEIVIECKRPEVSEAAFRQSVERAVRYASSIRAQYVWVTSLIKNEFYEITSTCAESRRMIAEIPSCGTTAIVKYRYGVRGGARRDGSITTALKTVTASELSRRFALAHQALWGGGELNPSDAFDEFDKLVFCKIWDERKDREDGEPYDFQVIIESDDDTTNRSLLSRLKCLYEEGRDEAPELFRDDIRLSASKVRTVVSYLEDINLSATDLDAKGRAFESFLKGYFRGMFGQFFTPRPVVKFVVDALPITYRWRVLDTSCGSGGFLLYALDKVRTEAENQFGKGSASAHSRWHEFARKRLFGIEINEQIARTAKMNMIIHDDGHTNVVTSDGLLPTADIIHRTGNLEFAENSFDCIITNPPFGSLIKRIEHSYLNKYELAFRAPDWLQPRGKCAIRTSVPSEVLFIEQCWNFLKEGGYLAIVLPDGVLTNASLQYVRDWIIEKFRILAVVSLPQTAFMSTGAGVKSSVLFLRKRSIIMSSTMRKQRRELQEEIVSRYLQGRESKSRLPVLMRDKAMSEFQRRWRDCIPKEKVLMAIAENIGYDALGRESGINELEEIGARLRKIISGLQNESSI